jgi:hypothetical protein
VGFTYPSSLTTAANSDMGGFSSAYTQAGNVITSTASATGGTVTASRNAGNFTFVVSGIPIAAGTTEPQFQFTVNLTTPVGFAPASVNGSGCPNCFRQGQVASINTATGAAANNVNFTYLDLTAAGLTYSTLGVWDKTSTVQATRQLGGAFAFGVLTRGQDLPTTNSATYNGPMIGRYADGAGVFAIGASATAVANFGTRSVAFSTSNTTKTLLSGAGTNGLDSTLNLSGTLNYLPGNNSLASTATGITSNNMSGIGRAAFFGPPGTTAPFAPPELGGVVAVSNSTGSQTLVGSFALKR